MSKEYLDELNRLGAIRKFDGGDNYSLGDKKEFKTLKKALQRLEAIDNSNPSKAMKCVLDIENNYKFYAHNKQDIDYQCNTIKQALLKAQESKKYLKWEDLEFTKDTKCQKAKMNDKEYTLHYFILYDNHKEVIIQDNDGSICTVCNEKFFNDLHLESVE